VGARLEERGRLPLLQPGWTRAALHAYRLGQRLEALCAAPLNRVWGASALHALDGDALSPPWRPQETTTLTLYGADEAAPHRGEGPVPPRPAYGHSQDGHDALQHGLLRLGVCRGGRPLRRGGRDGHTRDSRATPVALEECLALRRAGRRGLVADRQAYGQRPLGVCVEQRVGLMTFGPRPCAVRQEVAAWGQPPGPLPLWLETPGRTRQEAPRRWHGARVVRQVAGADAAGRLAMAERRFLVGHASPVAHQTAEAYAAAPAQEAERRAEDSRRVAARGCACTAAAAAAIAASDGRGQGRRGRPPPPWREPALH
jgi:hypothetical protein